MFHLTATPVNNALTDFQHLIEFFPARNTMPLPPALGIHNLAAHFRQLEKQLAGIVSGQVFGELFTANQVEAGQVLFSDKFSANWSSSAAAPTSSRARNNRDQPTPCSRPKKLRALPNTRSKKPTAICSAKSKSLSPRKNPCSPSRRITPWITPSARWTKKATLKSAASAAWFGSFASSS